MSYHGPELAFLYPLSEFANMRERLGSVDYVPKP